MTDVLNQETIERRAHAVDIGVLQEQMRQVMAGQAEQKTVNAEQTKQLQSILDKLSEARGGWRTLMWLGGAAASFGSLMTWALQHVTFK